MLSRTALFATVALAVFALGCGESLIPIVNCELAPWPEFSPTLTTDKASLGVRAGIDDLLWLEVKRAAPSDPIGGFVSANDDHGGGLVLLLPGASTFQETGAFGAALSLYDDYGHHFSEAGYLVWALAPLEDAPYGGDAVDAVVDAIDWLDEEGRTLLDVERVYLVGYSVGATTANGVNLRRDVTAVVSLAGLTEALQLQVFSDLYYDLTDLFPCNTGMNQLRLTLDMCAESGGETLDVVSRVAEIRNPTLFVHALDDLVYFSSNSRHVQAAYEELLRSAAVDAPELTFYYAPVGGHFVYVQDPQLLAPVLDYLARFEPQE